MLHNTVYEFAARTYYPRRISKSGSDTPLTLHYGIALSVITPEGTGIIAGGPVRSVVELAGIKNIRTKSLGSNNKTNVVLATIEGLTKLKTPEEVAKNRGKSVEDVVC